MASTTSEIVCTTCQTACANLSSDQKSLSMDCTACHMTCWTCQATVPPKKKERPSEAKLLFYLPLCNNSWLLQGRRRRRLHLLLESTREQGGRESPVVLQGRERERGRERGRGKPRKKEREGCNKERSLSFHLFFRAFGESAIESGVLSTMKRSLHEA